MEKAQRQLQWEGCSVFIYRWALHLLEASNNLAYSKLPFKALELRLEDVPHSGSNTTHTSSPSAICLDHTKCKGKSKSKSKGSGFHTWKFITRGRNLLHLVSAVH